MELPHLLRPSLARPIARDATPVADLGPESRELVTTVRAVAIVAALIATATLAMGLAFGEPRVVVVAAFALAYAGWLGVETHVPLERFGEQSVVRIAFATLGLIGVCAMLEPAVGAALTVAAVVPVVLALPYASARSVAFLMVCGGIVGSVAWIAGATLSWESRVPASLQMGLAFMTLIASMAFLLLFLWQVSRRLKGTAADLRSVVTMSSDLATSMDPRLVGDRIALHISRAVAADDCAISYWDAEGDQVVTLGFYPPERRSTLADIYALDAYPATRRMLQDQRATVIQVDDPTGDPSERNYLESLGHRSMLMLPLVASGVSIGLIELTSARADAFDAGRIRLASMLAHEAAMALENARLYERIRHQAFHDGLTGLANRAFLRDEVAHALEDQAGPHQPIAVLLIDLDAFKDVNDRLGHARGDAALVDVAERIRSSLRPGDLAARLGGDEFAVLLRDVADPDTAQAVADRLLEGLHRPFDLGGVSVELAASIGIAMDTGIDSVDDLLRDADIAMYAAKATARGHSELFRPAMRDALARRSELAARLRGADSRGELRLDYQPIVDLGSGRIVSLEALLRWQAPGHALAMPADFLELAEETGDILPIGHWVIREACRQMRDWQVRLDLDRLAIGVNLSARQFQDDAVVDVIRESLRETGLDARDLIIEITESALMQDSIATTSRLEVLRDLGVRLAIDDFGTGYSSLSYLERFPVDILKIDRSFIADLDSRGSRPVLASAIVELGRALGLEVVAEGVERVEQLDALRAMGCRQVQGYLLGRPVAPDAIEATLARPGSAAAARPWSGRRPLRLVSGA